MDAALERLCNQEMGEDLEIIIQDADIEPDQGQSDALNKGFAKARGEWLFWLNADDVLLPGALKKVKMVIHSTTTTSDYDFLFTGPLDDDAKWSAYARADLFVLPTYSENFGIVVAEALWAGVPVITTKGTPWDELECSASSKFRVQSSKLEERCGWWIDLPPIDSLDKALREAFEHSNNPNTRTVLPGMGRCGRKLVEARYTWAAVGDKMVRGYEEVLNGRA